MNWAGVLAQIASYAMIVGVCWAAAWMNRTPRA
jgi:hypothetical protein